MRVFVCPQCIFSVAIVGDFTELTELVNTGLDGGRCPHCQLPVSAENCPWEAELDPKLHRIRRDHTLSPHEAFLAFQGMGLPKERQIPEPEGIVELLNTGVTRISATRWGPNNFLSLDYIEVRGGIRIYFGSSSDGPIIYRVTDPTSYTELATRSKG